MRRFRGPGRPALPADERAPRSLDVHTKHTSMHSERSTVSCKPLEDVQTSPAAHVQQSSKVAGSASTPPLAVPPCPQSKGLPAPSASKQVSKTSSRHPVSTRYVLLSIDVLGETYCRFLASVPRFFVGRPAALSQLTLVGFQRSCNRFNRPVFVPKLRLNPLQLEAEATEVSQTSVARQVNFLQALYTSFWHQN